MGYHHGWTVQILPFIGQDNVYRRFDLEESVYAPSNETARSVTISTFLCPSSRAGRNGSISYAGCHHDVEAPIAADNHGVLYLNSHVRFDDITDGLAQTILLGELKANESAMLSWASGTRATLRNTGAGLNSDNPFTALYAGIAAAQRSGQTGGRRQDVRGRCDPGRLCGRIFERASPGSKFRFLRRFSPLHQKTVRAARVPTSGQPCRWRADQRRHVLTRVAWSSASYSRPGGLAPRIGGSCRLMWCHCAPDRSRCDDAFNVERYPSPAEDDHVDVDAHCVDRSDRVARGIGPGADRRSGFERRAPTFRPDPATVQRFGPGYRYPQAGWIVLHIEGEPYERGYQHGRLMAPEIAGFIGEVARYRSNKAPADAWQDLRLIADALFLRRFDAEFLEEMKGIADGAAAAGARWEGRPVDLLDLVTINADVETNFLENALEATATGLEGRRFREPLEQGPDSNAGITLQRLRRDRAGHGRWAGRLWPHHHVEPFSRLPLQRLDRHQARAGASRLNADVPRRNHERSRLLHE